MSMVAKKDLENECEALGWTLTKLPPGIKDEWGALRWEIEDEDFNSTYYRDLGHVNDRLDLTRS